MTEVFVQSEFAPLRVVVLARSEVSIPANARDSADTRFLAEDSFVLNPVGQDMRDGAPERQAAWERERDAFREVLERHGVRVLRPRLLTGQEKTEAGDDGYANFFARDPFFTVGDQVVESSMRFRHRRREVLPMREIMLTEVYPAECGYVAVPAPEIPEPDDPALGPGPFLEGGDVLVLDRHVFVGSSGLASNALGARWLAKYLAPYGYTVELVRLHERILHLDCALGLVRDGLLVACEEALLDGVPEVLRDWERIGTDFDSATRLATNGLPLSPDVYVTDPEFSFLGDQIRRRGVKVEYVDFAITRSLGGSFRCSTQPLLRTS
ncbi:arginine deiminase family protein [Nonomuraea sp. NBC_01738]|uniref:dimethylarginine dimethylaminohydrolase family protein n=1 Tax=Nonomuraea sp. NBC_01738 TaxID=2976003 RepID=UPI002E167860|nr:arginine deiminase family protein [Nonomuraea sp. NBC_01738]